MHSWQKRALDPDSPTTKDNETVRTTSSEYRGKEILYPTIRMIDGKLKKLSDKEAKQYALVKNDYIEFVSPNQAEAWSKSFSNLINDTREDMNQRQAGNVLRRNAPRGEFPAFINQQEANWLMGQGASGRPTKSGLRSYAMDADTRAEVDSTKKEAEDRTFNVGGSGDFSVDNVKPWMEERFGKWGVSPVEGGSGSDAGSGGSGGGSGGSGVSGQQTRTDTQTSQSSLDKPVREFRDKVLDKASGVMDQEYQKYEGDRFAGPAQDTITAQQAVRDMQGQGQGAFTSAGQTAQNLQGANIDPITGQSFLTGQGVDQYMSPHTQNVIGGMRDNAMRTMQMQRNQLGADAQMAGAVMGSRSAIEKGVMAGEVQRNLGQQVAGALEGSYAQAAKMKQADMDREQQRQRYNQLSQTEEGRLQLAGADARLRATDAGRQAGYQDAQMLSRVGADIEGRDQNQKDFDYQQFLEGRDWDKNQAMFGANVAGGAPSGTMTAQNTPMYRNTNPWGSALSGAALGYSVGGPWGAAVGGGLGYMGGRGMLG